MRKVGPIVVVDVRQETLLLIRWEIEHTAQNTLTCGYIDQHRGAEHGIDTPKDSHGETSEEHKVAKGVVAEVLEQREHKKCGTNKEQCQPQQTAANIGALAETLFEQRIGHIAHMIIEQRI